MRNAVAEDRNDASQSLEDEEEWLENIDVDVHYFISLPEATPLHSRFDKSSTVTLTKPQNPKDSGRISFTDYETNKSTLVGSIDLLTVEYDEDHENLVHIELDYGDDFGASLGEDWMIEAFDSRNENPQPWRPFCLDLYFWKKRGAEAFLRQLQQLQEAQKSLVETLPGTVAESSDMPVLSQNENELAQMKLFAITCLDSSNSTIFVPEDQGSLTCRIVQNQTTKITRLLVECSFEYGLVSLTYTLSRRSFSYQLPDSTVQVRFLHAEKVVKSSQSGDARLVDIQDARMLDSPIFRFEVLADAIRFQEILRGEKMVFNCIVQWLRATSTTADGNAIALGVDAGNFTSVDDRRLHLWQNVEGFTKIVFHRQFHLVTSFITRNVVAAQEPGTPTVRVAGLRIKTSEGLPKFESKTPSENQGIDASLKLRFPTLEAASMFVGVIGKYRDLTQGLVANPQNTTAVQFLAREDPLEQMRRPQNMATGLGLRTPPLAALITGTSPGAPDQTALSAFVPSRTNADLHTINNQKSTNLFETTGTLTTATQAIGLPIGRSQAQEEELTNSQPGQLSLDQSQPQSENSAYAPAIQQQHTYPLPRQLPPQLQTNFGPPSVLQPNVPPLSGTQQNMPPTPGFPRSMTLPSTPGLPRNMTLPPISQHNFLPPQSSQLNFAPPLPAQPGYPPPASQQGHPVSAPPQQNYLPPPQQQQNVATANMSQQHIATPPLPQQNNSTAPMLLRSQTMPAPAPPPLQTGGRRLPPPMLYQLPARGQFIQAPMASPRFAAFESPQSPMSATFHTQPLSPFGSNQPQLMSYGGMQFQPSPQQATSINQITRSPSNAQMTQSATNAQIARSPSNAQMAGSPSNAAAGINGYFPHANSLPTPVTTPATPTSPQNQLPRTRSPSVTASTKYPLHTRNLSGLGNEMSRAKESNDQDKTSPREIDSPDRPIKKGQLPLPPPEDLEPINPALGGNVPVSPNTKYHQNSSSMSKMLRRLR